MKAALLSLLGAGLLFLLAYLHLEKRRNDDRKQREEQRKLFI